MSEVEPFGRAVKRPVGNGRDRLHGPDPRIEPLTLLAPDLAHAGSSVRRDTTCKSPALVERQHASRQWRSASPIGRSLHTREADRRSRS